MKQLTAGCVFLNPYSLSVSIFSVIPNKRLKLWGFLPWNLSSAKMYLQRWHLLQWQLTLAAGAGWMKLLDTRVSVVLPDQIGKVFLNHKYLQDTNAQRTLRCQLLVQQLCCQICRFSKLVARHVVFRMLGGGGTSVRMCSQDWWEVDCQCFVGELSVFCV